MKLVRFRNQQSEVLVGQLHGDRVKPVKLAKQYRSLADILEEDDPHEVVAFLGDSAAALPLEKVKLLAPLDQQEVWAAGVTYKRSQSARMEESDTAADCYDRVYNSLRPELFFKATPHRVAGPDEAVRIRTDSKWNVPEPELTLVLNSRLRLVGFTCGNDMSSRDIEGENPLYLPQAKLYDRCCALGPCITLLSGMPAPEEIGIGLRVLRQNKVAYSGTTRVSEMARTYEDLIGWLGRDNSFPNGVFLLTGTGIVPESDFTLQKGDIAEITIDGIGTLRNPVVQG